MRSTWAVSPRRTGPGERYDDQKPDDRHRAGFHGDDAVVDIGEQLFAGAEVAEAVRAGDGKAGLFYGLLQFERQPLAVLVLQLAEARGDDGGRARAGRCGITDYLHGKTRRHQHQHMIGREGEAMVAAGHGLRWYDFQGDSDYTRGFSGSSVTSPGPLERVPNPLLRRLYPRALHRMLDAPGISRLKQVVRSRGWPGSLKSMVYPAIIWIVSVSVPSPA